ncbi:hypothetical protein JAAARDRAFT_196426 [Jaapia argillacea MUCL 33604]|uniref:Sugar phosphate phosphatase n=1 Tax=Jaapia argillacea MUCL 33604 TaxID=933084 RepID=A0A067PL00_9AGAM|nr:hypothetical protein JAAARDRAFT_196426 [Jaapia argillacea MUCL 33604]
MFEAPYPPYDPTDKSGFSYDTVIKRWPIILTSVIDHLHRVNHDLFVQAQRTSIKDDSQDAKIKEAQEIIGKVSALKYHMARDHALEPIAEDGEPLVDTYNSELAQLGKSAKNTWFTAPWLYAECYLYRLIRSYFAQTKHWNTYDPFLHQKQETFKKSGEAIYHLATTMHEFEVERDLIQSDPEKLGVLFREMCQMCLWGNATDLSLLTHMSHEDIQRLQSVGKDAQSARKEFILKDDSEALWNHIASLKNERVDFVLDNAGFELVTDLIFADFLVTYTPYVSKVIFHPKLIPWFVSDVMPPDFSSTITSLLDPSFFPPPPSGASTKPEEFKQNLESMVMRWQKYISDGTFELSVPSDTKIGEGNAKADFWTSPYPYWNMKERAPELWEGLIGSGLVIFKGDLNYRKLTGDIRWPASTAFATAIGPLAGSFPILSLRTNKADVVVGVDQDIADRLDKSGEKWRVNGKFALVSFLARR